MGCCCSADRLILVFFGLHNAGKSTIIGQIEYHSFRVTNPTIEREESFAAYKDKQVEIWDIPEQNPENWVTLCNQSNGIVFVIDARNRTELPSFFQLANQILEEEDNSLKPILFYINWASSENAISEQELQLQLNISSRHKKEIYFQECNAKTGDGIIEGYHWIMSKIERIVDI